MSAHEAMMGVMLLLMVAFACLCVPALERAHQRGMERVRRAEARAGCLVERDPGWYSPRGRHVRSGRSWQR